MRYRFLWRRDIERKGGDGGWRSKVINADSDSEAAEKMVSHLETLISPVEVDYEMARLDIPYSSAKHAEHFWNMHTEDIPLGYGIRMN